MADTQYKKVVKVEIGVAGTDVDLTAILFIASRLMSDGPGGEMLSPRTVPNTVNPVDVDHHHKWWELIVALDENAYVALFGTDVVEGAGTGYAIVPGGDNSPIGVLKVTIDQTGTGDQITWTYEASKSYVSNFTERIADGEAHKPSEVKFICIGSRTVAAV